MKLWRLNAVLIILILGVCTCNKFATHAFSENLIRNEMAKMEEAYEENDKFIETIEKESNIKIKSEPANLNNKVDNIDYKLSK